MPAVGVALDGAGERSAASSGEVVRRRGEREVEQVEAIALRKDDELVESRLNN